MYTLIIERTVAWGLRPLLLVIKVVLVKGNIFYLLPLLRE